MTAVRSLVPNLALAGVLLATACPRPAAAAGIPVHDSTNLAQIAATVTALLDIYRRQNEELAEALRTTRAVTGALGLGTIHQTPELIRVRRSLPVLMHDLNRLSDLTTSPDLARTLTLYGRLTDRYGLLEDIAYEPRSPDAPYAHAWRADRDAQLAATTTSEIVYENLDHRQELYGNLMTELDTREDLKASVDILARLTAENGRLLMELIRLQSAATQASATAQLAQQTQAANVRRMADYEDLPMEDW